MLQWLDNDFHAHELFVDLYEMSGISARVFGETLPILQLPLAKIRSNVMAEAAICLKQILVSLAEFKKYRHNFFQPISVFNR